jgi:hypothetical protein
MQTPDVVWSSNLEVLAAARLQDKPLLIWSTTTQSHGFLLDFTTQCVKQAAIHLLFSGNHYDALCIGIETNLKLIAALYNQQPRTGPTRT